MFLRSHYVQKYKLSDNRILETQCNGTDTIVVIRDLINGKSTEILAKRWSSFLLHDNDIMKAVKQLKEKRNVNFREHFGGG